MIRHFLLAAVLAAANVLPLSAQQFDRRSRDEPEVVVEAGGRYSTCDVLLFDPAGRHLFAGGDDKVVRVWPYSAAGLETDRTKAQTLRWRAWREQRGGVKAVAVSADGARVAVGGYGMKPSTVAVLDRATGDTLALTWPQSRPGTDNFNAVTAVAFHPDDARIGFGTADGSLWVWTPEKLKAPDANGRPSPLPRWAGKLEPMPGAGGRAGEFNVPRLVYFADAETLVAVGQSGQVAACAVGGMLPEIAADDSPAKTRFNVNDGQAERYAVYRAARTADGKRLVVAFAGPRVALVRADGKNGVALALPADHFPRSIAIDPKTGLLAVGVARALPAAEGKARFYAEGHDELWLYDDAPAADAKPTKHPFRGPAEALAFHPTDGRLAVAGGDADEVTLLDPAVPNKPVSVVREAGRRPWAVGLTENGKVFGVRTGRDPAAADPNARGIGAWTRFDIPRLTPTRDESQKWVTPISAADGWSIRPDEADRFTWDAVRTRDGETIRYRLPLDRHRDQAPTCFSFLPATGGGPTRVLVGHYYGCSLFELTPAGVVRTKLFTGHGGEVLSLAVAKDRTWFVTGGADQTVAAWTLADWPSRAGLGAAFEGGDGGVKVAAVDTGSPAWEAGLRPGESLDHLAVGGLPVYDRRAGAKPAGTSAVALAALAEDRPGVELFFGRPTAGMGERRESLTTVRQRPLWKWFPAFDDHHRLTDWAVWMWHGSFYHTKSAHGDRLAGWHVNHPEPGGRPAFYQLQQFEKQFHRPEVIEKLVNTRDVAAALADARGDNPLPASFAQYEPAPVRLGLKSTVAGVGGLDLTVAVTPRGSNPDLLPDRVELWVNDHRYKVWDAHARKPLEVALTLPPGALRAGENQLSVLTFNAAGGRAEDVRTVSNPRAAGPTDLLGLSVGINDYSGHRKNASGARAFGDLTSALKDARGLTDRLLAFGGPNGCFRDARIDLRLDVRATRRELLASLAATGARAKPDDLLVVFFAGHGDLLNPGAGGAPGGDVVPRPTPVKGGLVARGTVAGGGQFVFCCPDYTPKNPAGTALSADELFDALAKVNCRKVVLLDACHSGQAADANLLRRFVPHGQGPFVIASCDQGELSYEDPALGHGLFTYAVMEALGGGFRRADADSDGGVSADELYAYVAARVPQLMKEIGKPADTQNPICFPRQPPRFVVVKR